MPKVIESIQSFLSKQPHNGKDLLARYLRNLDTLETQVNVSAGKGWVVEGKGKVYTDGLDEWWPIRIPKKANSTPVWRDYNMTWALDEHVEGIGCTGWDWDRRRSMWVGFDFDAIAGHAKGMGITDEELARVKEAACQIPWVEVRKSTGGKGLHLYVYLDLVDLVIENHTVHAALARTILGMMSNEANFDFAGHVDVCGGNMWIWHRKMTADNGGLAVVKEIRHKDQVEEGEDHDWLTSDRIPANWKDNVQVVTRQRAKIRVNGVDELDIDPFEALASSRLIVPLDSTHKTIIDELRATKHSTVWVQDHHLLQTHTCALQMLMDNEKTVKRLNLQGCFKTRSDGKDPGTPNCFLFPLDNGAFKVYLFGRGRAEEATWEQDGQGWTTCLFNHKPSLKVAARANKGLEDGERREWVFDTLTDATLTAKALGQQKVDVTEGLENRESTLKSSKDGRLIMSIVKKDGDGDMRALGWVAKKDKWVRTFDVKADNKPQEVSYMEYDNILRALVTAEPSDAGWVYKSADGDWDRFPTEKVKLVLMAMGNAEADAKLILGNLLKRRWKLVNLPFQPEYPGNRQWNHKAAQFRYAPTTDDTISHPHWDMVLRHCGQDLDDALKNLEWAQESNIKIGADYLTAWAACMFREPLKHLPYLFFYSPKQNTGKSIFHEALALLMTSGVAAADKALTNTNDFCGELANAVLAYIEEKDISASGKSAYNKIKDWVTSPVVWIHKKGMTPYSQPNTLHFIHTANGRDEVPVFPGDSRITMMFVPDLKPGQEIPKDILLERLIAEAPHFMRTLMDFQLPPVIGRLRLPVVNTLNKEAAEDSNKTSLERFIDDECASIIGHIMPFAEFYEAFCEWLSPEEQVHWTKQRVIKSLPETVPYGKHNQSIRSIGNVALAEQGVQQEPKAKAVVSRGGRLHRS